MSQEKKSLEARTDMTELEALLGKSFSIDGGNTLWNPRGALVQGYITLLEKCNTLTPTKENDGSFSYRCAITKFHGYNPAEQIQNNEEQKLRDLETLGLTNSKRFSIVTITAQSVYENGESIMPLSDRTKLTISPSYITTEKGKKLLEEHKKAKSEQSIS